MIVLTFEKLFAVSICLPHGFFFFFNDTATTEIYTLSLHDALPISGRLRARARCRPDSRSPGRASPDRPRDRKSTRLNSSHMSISYAVFCLKKKNEKSKGPEYQYQNQKVLLAK